VSLESSSLVVVERSLDGAVDPLDLLRWEGTGARRPGQPSPRAESRPATPRFYFAPHDGEPAVAARGAVARVVAADPSAVAAAMAAHDPSRRATWVGGFAFDPAGRARRAAMGDDPWRGFPPSLWLLPEVCMVRDAAAQQTRLIVAGDGVDLGALRSRADDIAAWLERASALGSELRPPLALPGADGVPSASPDLDRALDIRLARAIEAVRRGDAAKVVLAAARSRRLPEPVDPVALLAVVRRDAPGCTAFLIEPEAGRSLLGATPERLLRLSGSRVWTMALAGSAARGETPQEDAELASALLASDKDLEEHRLVVASIVRGLRAAGVSVTPTLAPRLRRLARIQHLETPIAGDLDGGGDVLALASRLHPTPALGGEPPEAALALIRALEGEDRGWYGGAVGWRDGQGNGDLAVVIRALHLAERNVTAFAGAGLVAASDPQHERAEIALKLEVAFAPLGGGPVLLVDDVQAGEGA
jgi:isochorismate synthase